METTTKPNRTADYNAYMREYKRAKYAEDKEGARDYRNSLRYKKKLDLPPEDFAKYGKHLADMVKLRNLLDKLPAEFVASLLPQPVPV